MEIQSLCVTGKVPVRKLGYEILFVWDICSEVVPQARLGVGLELRKEGSLKLQLTWEWKGTAQRKCGAKRTWL